MDDLRYNLKENKSLPAYLGESMELLSITEWFPVSDKSVGEIRYDLFSSDKIIDVNFNP